MKIPSILSIFFCLFLISCESTIAFQDNVESTRISSIRSQEEAEFIAIQALRNFVNNPNTKGMSREISTTFAINSVKTKSSAKDTLMYAVNFADSAGFALVSADRNAPELLAMVYSGNYSGEKTDCPAFNAYIQDLTENLSKSRTIPDLASANEMIFFDYDTTIVEHSVEPIISWDWHQDAPFNTYCISNTGEVCSAGCGAVAVAHAISRYSYPTTIDLTFDGAPLESITLNWSICKYHDVVHGQCETCNKNALLMREIGELCNITYGGENSGVTTVHKMRDCLTLLGYQSQLHEGYNINSIINSLDSEKAVILKGGRLESDGSQVGHSWIVDGYKYYEQTVKCYSYTSNSPLKMYEGYETRKTWYLNFEYGWRNSSYDGYYIAYSKLSGNGHRFDKPTDVELITMFECANGYTNSVYMLTDICPDNSNSN